MKVPLTLVMLMFPAPAEAGFPTQAKAENVEPQPTDSNIGTARIMAKCVWKRRPDGVNSLLAATDTRRFAWAWRGISLTVQGCSSTKVVGVVTSITTWSMPFATIRALFAEARFQQKGLPVLAPANYDAVVAGSDWITDDAALKVALRTADCLAARQPQRVARVLSAAPGSADESAAFVPLETGLGACLEQGVTLSARPATLRLALASALDRRMRMAKSGTGAN